MVERGVTAWTADAPSYVVLVVYRAINQLECISTRQKHLATIYVIGLVADRNKTVQGISNHVLPAKSERA